MLRTSLYPLLLLSCGSTGGYEANNLVVAFRANGVSDQQHSYATGEANCLPACFARLVDSILFEQSVRIFEDGHGVVECDAVLHFVDPRFHWGPFESKHSVCRPSV